MVRQRLLRPQEQRLGGGLVARQGLRGATGGGRGEFVVGGGLGNRHVLVRVVRVVGRGGGRRRVVGALRLRFAVLRIAGAGGRGDVLGARRLVVQVAQLVGAELPRGGALVGGALRVGEAGGLVLELLLEGADGLPDGDLAQLRPVLGAVAEGLELVAAALAGDVGEARVEQRVLAGGLEDADVDGGLEEDRHRDDARGVVRLRHDHLDVVQLRGQLLVGRQFELEERVRRVALQPLRHRLAQAHVRQPVDQRLQRVLRPQDVLLDARCDLVDVAQRGGEGRCDGHLVHVAVVVQSALLHAQRRDDERHVVQTDRRRELDAAGVAPRAEAEERVVVDGELVGLVVPAALHDAVRLLVVRRRHVDRLQLGEVLADGEGLGVDDVPQRQLLVAEDVVGVRVDVQALAVLRHVREAHVQQRLVALARVE